MDMITTASAVPSKRRHKDDDDSPAQRVTTTPTTPLTPTAPMAEVDQAQHSRLMRLPAELRNAIYEEVLEHDGVVRKTLSPQLLLTCKQTYREAQSILDGNTERVAIVRIKSELHMPGNTHVPAFLKLGSAPSIEVSCVKRLDSAFAAWHCGFGDRKYAIIYIDLADGRSISAEASSSTVQRPPEAYRRPESSTSIYKSEAVTQQLYCLATALGRSKIQTVEVRIELSKTGIEMVNRGIQSIDHCAMLWPMMYSGPNVEKVYYQGVPDDGSLWSGNEGADENDRAPPNELSKWLNVRQRAVDLESLVKKAGIKATGVRYLPLSLDRMFPRLTDLPVIDPGFEKWIHSAVRGATLLLDGHWRALKEKAGAVLESRGTSV